ncbi:MAG: hypothetical protein ACLQLG_07315 [Thermoguttaceae bacterium]
MGSACDTVLSENRDGSAVKEIGSGAIACCVSTALVMAFVAASDRCLDWFLLPVWCCGVLIGTDAVDWIRGRVSLFDPIGILGLLGVHFFFLAPLLHVAWGFWMVDAVPSPGWHYWLAGMALVNLLGLLAYRLGRRFAARGPGVESPDRIWTIDPGRFWPAVILALAVMALLQVWVYARFGGIGGMIAAATDPDRLKYQPLRGWGAVLMVSEGFPILAIMALAVFARRRAWLRSPGAVVLSLVGFLALAMFFGGLHGSRSNTVWTLFWAVGIIHFWVRPFNKKWLICGGVFVLMFMYLYGFFKSAGLEAFSQLTSPEARAAMETKTGRSGPALLLGDLGRSDVQAYLLYRTWAAQSDYRLAWGRTYLGDVAIFVPRALWPARPPTKVREGTEAMDGVGSYREDVWESSQVYGLAGEAMLNFGPLAVPVAFFGLGLLVARLRWLLIRLRPFDSRLLLFPFLVNLTFIVLVGDLDNILYDTSKHLLMPLLLIGACSSRRCLGAEPLKDAAETWPDNAALEGSEALA